MTKFAKIILSLIIVAVIGVVYFVSRVTPVENPIVEVPKGDDVSNSSIKGCYIARLAKDVYTLRIDSYSNPSIKGMLSYNNFEKDSSAGTLIGTFDGTILFGDYSFESEGMNSVRQVMFKKIGNTFVQGYGITKSDGDKESFDDVSKVTYDSKSTFTKSNDCASHFEDTNKIFSYDYNSFFKVIVGNNKLLTPEWRLDSKQRGMLLATTVISRTFMPKTNFSDAKLTIGRSTDPTAIKNCTSVDTNGEMAKGDAKISGYSFAKFVAGDAGAGNFYDRTSYRGIVDGDCYSIEYNIHSTNIGAYGPDQGIKEFDKALIEGELEKIIKSFKFTINSN